MCNSSNNMLEESAAIQINKEYQIYFLFVVFLISLQLICNTIEPIILTLGKFKIPASAVFYVLSFAISDIITEVFGFKLAVRATVLNVISQLIYCSIAATIFLVPKSFQTLHAAESFQYIFHFLSLELLSSISALLIAMIANDYIINRLKLIFLGKGFWWRTIISTVIGEIIMLNIDYNTTFFGEKSLLEIQYLIFCAMAYKIIAAVVLALPVAMLAKYISNNVFFMKPNMNHKTYIITDLKNAILLK